MEHEPTFAALGKKVNAFKGFDTFPKPLGVFSITMRSDEVTAVCPVTEQPDQYTIEIVYSPEELCLESKSLKLYFQTFRNMGIFVEALSAQIAQDISCVLRCHVSVTITQKSRGGITIVSHANSISVD